jgi:hypothetical protein
MKALIIAGAASFMAAPAFAGPYVQGEANSGFIGSDYSGTVTELHMGYEGNIGDSASFYVQAGPDFVSPDGEEMTTEIGGKIGIGADVSDNVNVYAEVAARTQAEINLDEDLAIGTKVGIRYSF